MGLVEIQAVSEYKLVGYIAHADFGIVLATSKDAPKMAGSKPVYVFKSMEDVAAFNDSGDATVSAMPACTARCVGYKVVDIVAGKAVGYDEFDEFCVVRIKHAAVFSSKREAEKAQRFYKRTAI